MEQIGYPRAERQERADYRSRPTGAAGAPAPKTGQQMLLRLIGLQAVLCALVLAAVFLISHVSPAAMARMQEGYARITARDVSASELLGKLRQGGKAVRSRLEQAVAAQAEPASAAQAETMTGLEVISDETGETVAVGVVEAGAGGGDLADQEAKKGLSFAPYTVSAKVTMPVTGARITSKFGYRTNPISGNYGFHTGLDLAAPAGTPVAAAFYGTVEETGENDVWGKYILLRHSDSLETYYCHFSAVNVRAGTVLRSGEIIGYVGSTGWSTGPHLHFEVRIDGIRVDPERLLFPSHFDAA